MLQCNKNNTMIKVSLIQQNYYYIFYRDRGRLSSIIQRRIPNADLVKLNHTVLKIIQRPILLMTSKPLVFCFSIMIHVLMKINSLYILSHSARKLRGGSALFQAPAWWMFSERHWFDGLNLLNLAGRIDTSRITVGLHSQA